MKIDKKEGKNPLRCLKPTKNNNPSTNLQKTDLALTKSDHEKAEVLNDYFSAVFRADPGFLKRWFKCGRGGGFPLP